ncbi:MAG: 1-acyl-sn-glycerol-3-phosphate acyltransferase [Clostridia bacterium]|nr:1-acyl-sn-glycerol-3-phosphate acyltransferase [Clostridia bacterium]
MNFYKVARAVVNAFLKIAFRIKVEGTENIPSEGALVVCSNHQSLCDPPMLAMCMPFELKFMAKEELFKNRLFGGLISALGAFPVKRGTGDIGALKIAIKVLSEGDRLVIFPEGARSPENYMGKGKSGAALIAIKSKANILPVGVCGKYKLFSRIVVRIGKPIVLEEYFGTKVGAETLQDITDNKIMKTISELSGVPVYEDRDSE